MCGVYPVIHCDKINGIIVDEDFMRNWAKDAGTQRREGKCPFPLQMPFVKLHTNPHKHWCFTFVCDASHVINKPALFISLPPATSSQTLLLSFFSCCILYCPGFPLCPVIHLPLFPLCLLRSLSVQQGHWNPTAKQRGFENFNRFPAEVCSNVLQSTFNSLVVAVTCGNGIMRS